MRRWFILTALSLCGCGVGLFVTPGWRDVAPERVALPRAAVAPPSVCGDGERLIILPVAGTPSLDCGIYLDGIGPNWATIKCVNGPTGWENDLCTYGLRLEQANDHAGMFSYGYTAYATALPAGSRVTGAWLRGGAPAIEAGSSPTRNLTITQVPKWPSGCTTEDSGDECCRNAWSINGPKGPIVAQASLLSLAGGWRIPLEPLVINTAGTTNFAWWIDGGRPDNTRNMLLLSSETDGCSDLPMLDLCVAQGPTPPPTAALPTAAPTPHCFPDPNCPGCFLCAVKTPEATP